MFDNIKGMAGLAGLMKDLPRVKARLEEIKQRLSEMTVEAETGGGAVRAIANGQLKLVSLRVDPSLMSGLVDAGDPDDRAMAEDLIAGAVNTALDKARQMAEEEFAGAAAELGIPLPPGGGLGGMLG